MLPTRSKSSNMLFLKLKSKKIPSLFLCFFITCLFTSFIALFIIPENKNNKINSGKTSIKLDLPEIDGSLYSSKNYEDMKNISISED
jgi:hypothetical protein